MGSMYKPRPQGLSSSLTLSPGDGKKDPLGMSLHGNLVPISLVDEEIWEQDYLHGLSFPKN